MRLINVQLANGVITFVVNVDLVFLAQLCVVELWSKDMALWCMVLAIWPGLFDVCFDGYECRGFLLDVLSSVYSCAHHKCKFIVYVNI